MTARFHVSSRRGPARCLPMQGLLEAVKDLYAKHVLPAVEKRAEKLHIPSPRALLDKVRTGSSAAADWVGAGSSPVAQPSVASPPRPATIKAVAADSPASALAPKVERSSLDLAPPREEPSFLASEPTALSVGPATPTQQTAAPETGFADTATSVRVVARRRYACRGICFCFATNLNRR